jgi:hypothetical protein
LIFTLALVTISHASFFQLKLAIGADASNVIIGNFDLSWYLSRCPYVSKNWGLLTPSFSRLGAHLLLKSYGVKFDEESGRISYARAHRRHNVPNKEPEILAIVVSALVCMEFPGRVVVAVHVLYLLYRELRSSCHVFHYAIEHGIHSLQRAD